MIDRTTVAAVARELGLAWDTVNSIAVQATGTIVAAEVDRFDGVTVIGVDEHSWAHTRHADGQGYVTVITDLTDVVAGQGPARLLDLVPGRSAAVFTRAPASNRRGTNDARSAAERPDIIRAAESP